jgi:hypothetical protein
MYVCSKVISISLYDIKILLYMYGGLMATPVEFDYDRSPDEVPTSNTFLFPTGC